MEKFNNNSTLSELNIPIEKCSYAKKKINYILNLLECSDMKHAYLDSLSIGYNKHIHKKFLSELIYASSLKFYITEVINLDEFSEDVQTEFHAKFDEIEAKAKDFIQSCVDRTDYIYTEYTHKFNNGHNYIFISEKNRLHARIITQFLHDFGLDKTVNLLTCNVFCKEFIQNFVVTDYNDDSIIHLKTFDYLHKVYDIFDDEVECVGQTDNINRFTLCEFSDKYFSSDYEYIYTEDNYTVNEYFRDELYYLSETDCYYMLESNFLDAEREANTEDYVDDYHSGNCEEFIFENSTSLRVGFEVEKEDEDVLQSCNIYQFKELTDYKYRKERDGSLDSETGFEIISPIFEFDMNSIKTHIKSNQTLKNHLNASGSYASCGTHINVSDEETETYNLYNGIQYYLPLLYAMYPSRAEERYCKAKTKDGILCENEKYQAIKVHKNRIEFRIFPVLRNVNQLFFRLQLVELFLKNRVNNFSEAQNKVNEVIYPFLLESGVYNEDKKNKLNNRFITSASNYKFIDEDFGIDFEDDYNDK